MTEKTGKKALKTIFNAAVFITICQAAGLIGTIFTMPSIPTWYETLNKPPFTPPNWLFGPAWLTLYTMMGIAITLIWNRKDKPSASKAINLFFVHLVLNALWSPIFFGAKLLFPAFIIIISIDIFIIILIRQFYKINKIAAYLMVPYFLWVSFASALNFAIWLLNM